MYVVRLSGALNNINDIYISKLFGVKRSDNYYPESPIQVSCCQSVSNSLKSMDTIDTMDKTIPVL